MKTLVYKRTHKGDPDKNGWFGIQDCMGQVRGYSFDAVIGVGGRGSRPHRQCIAEKINWIGLGARKKRHAARRGPLVTFQHFRLYEEKGDYLRTRAPILAKHLYSKNARILLNFTPAERKEVRRILNMAKTAPCSRRVIRVPHVRKRKGCGCPS